MAQPTGHQSKSPLEVLLGEMWRDLTRANLRLERILAHLGLEDVCEEEIDEAMDEG
jgi:hypothetical protein